MKKLIAALIAGLFATVAFAQAPAAPEAPKAEAAAPKAKKAKLDTAALGVEIAARKDELRELLARQAQLKVREGELEEAWMEALELLESMQAELEALS